LRGIRKSYGYIDNSSLTVQEKFDGFAGLDGKARKEAKAEFSENNAGSGGFVKMGRMG
jgi:hypothetical protein